MKNTPQRFATAAINAFCNLWRANARKKRNLFPKTFLLTWIAVGALWAGMSRAQVADFV